MFIVMFIDNMCLLLIQFHLLTFSFCVFLAAVETPPQPQNKTSITDDLYQKIVSIRVKGRTANLGHDFFLKVY